MDLAKGIAAGCAFLAAGLVAYSGNDGWGWLIVAGVLVAS